MRPGQCTARRAGEGMGEHLRALTIARGALGICYENVFREDTHMRNYRRIGGLVASALLALGTGVASAQQSAMTFFISGTGSGNGADYGGLAGADKHCQMLASAAGAGIACGTPI